MSNQGDNYHTTEYVFGLVFQLRTKLDAFHTEYGSRMQEV